MEYGLKNNFTYLKSKDDYAFSYDKLVEISRSYFGGIPDYDKIEETFIDCLIPQIFYLGIDELLSHSANSIYLLYIKINGENSIVLNKNKIKKKIIQSFLIKNKGSKQQIYLFELL